MWQQSRRRRGRSKHMAVGWLVGWGHRVCVSAGGPGRATARLLVQPRQRRLGRGLGLRLSRSRRCAGVANSSQPMMQARWLPPLPPPGRAPRPPARLQRGGGGEAA